MKWIAPYWAYIKWGGIAIAFLLTARWFYGQGYDASELRHMRNEQAAYEVAVSRAVKADEALRKALAEAPKAAPAIREVVRANPSGCAVPVPVARKLRDAIRQANATISR